MHDLRGVRGNQWLLDRHNQDVSGVSREGAAMKERVEHVERPLLPWRTQSPRTECGLPVADHPVMSRSKFEVTLKQLGKQRMAMVTCMTCFRAAERWPTWEQDPPRALSRECEWGPTFRAKEGTPIENELRALAELVERHRDEFDALLDSFRGAIRLDEHRRRNRRPA